MTKRNRPRRRKDNQKQSRRLNHETLERRELLAADFIQPVFAPGTSQADIDQWRADNQTTPESNNFPQERWGSSGNPGDGATITWSIVPDSTSVPDLDADDDAPSRTSRLIEFMDRVYGSGGAVSTAPVEQRPWFGLFQQAFDAWGMVSGIDFVFEPNDDGAPISNQSPGVPEVPENPPVPAIPALRGDIRIGGGNGTSQPLILGHTYGPDDSDVGNATGDIVLDIGDLDDVDFATESFFAINEEGPAGANTALHNTLTQLIGRAVGLTNTIPNLDGQRVMEESLTTAVRGPQHDDIIRIQTLYGDRFNDNDVQANASPIGALGNTTITDVSIDDDNDVDWYSFTAAAGQSVNITLVPEGQSYSVGLAGGNVQATNSALRSDLSFDVFDPDGILVSTQSQNQIGESEFLINLELDKTGDYRIAVRGQTNSGTQGPATGIDTPTQLYRLLVEQAIDGAPRLLAVTPNAGDLFDLDPQDQTLSNVRTQAPTELTITFGGTSDIDQASLGAISVHYSETGNFAQDSAQVEIGHAQVDDTGRLVTVRFANNLQDGFYQLRITSELMNLDPLPFAPNFPQPVIGTTDTSQEIISFEIELGGKVVAVVPQPIDVDASGTTARLNEIDVYFDDFDLFREGSTIEDPAFYKLVSTKNSATVEDDVVVNPEDELDGTGQVITPAVTRHDAERKVTLRFSANLDSFAGPGEALRLRIGDSTEFQTLTVNDQGRIGDPGFTTNAAAPMPTAATGNWSFRVRQEIDNVGLLAAVDSPGQNDEPGHRDNEVEDHFLIPIQGANLDRDSDTGITTQEITFLRNQPYMTIGGEPQINEMDADQEQRFLEVLDIYSDLLGVQFVETESSGLPLIVGNLAFLDPTVESGPGGTAGLGGTGGVVMDSQDFRTPADNVFGGSFFRVALHEVGHMLGIGHTYDLSPGTVLGATPEYPDSVRPGPSPTEWNFPNANDIVHGVHLHQNEAFDVDLYEFDVAEAGQLTVNAFAQQLPAGSLLDTNLVLYRQDGASLEQVARNDDYFGTDAFIEIDITPGTYFIGVAAQGNDDYDISNGIGAGNGGSEGDYELRVDFAAFTANTLTDSDGSLLDGDRDGIAGGNYDFWFEPSGISTSPGDTDNPTIYVQKGGGGTGSLADPFSNIDDALVAAGNLVDADNGISDVHVRVLPNAGDIAFEFGVLTAISQILADGRDLSLPKGVHMTVDSGVIMKFVDSRILVGSDVDGIDRSLTSISIQGTPELPDSVLQTNPTLKKGAVHFTSFNDTSIGVSTTPLESPGSGDWGGLEIRNDVDREQGRRELEREGIFLNYINHAEFVYGGGAVSSINRTVSPVHLSSARAEISYSLVRDSIAGISADPNTFEYTTFVEPRVQVAATTPSGFLADYQRIGPSIYGNQFIANSTNGLFIRIDTPAGGALERLTLPARLDDLDIVHTLTQNLLINGAPGDGIEYATRPSPILGITPTDLGSGNLANGTYRYSYTYVDAFGRETPASVPQEVVVNTANSNLDLSGIPIVPDTLEGFVSRRIYRSRVSGTPTPFQLIAELNRSDLQFVDSKATPDAFAPVLDTTVSEVIHGRIPGSLTIDPGIIFKSQGARIEAGFEANLIAEGIDGKEIIFTSRLDDSYGAGGTFDTNNDGSLTTPAAEDWGGIYAAPNSRLSLDRVLLAYAGGITGVGGGTTSFNPIQIHQADARIANSIFRDNGDGLGGNQLGGRTQFGFAPNDAATIYVTAAAPTIVGNEFLDNNGPGGTVAAISINVNSLDHQFRTDLGRQTGELDRTAIPPGNMGPVFRGNELDRNDINGLVVRGEVLAGEIVWDDTDIVHVLRSDIEVPDHHTYGGLRLESSSTESLVVKAENAEILATGRSLDITDRIGGRIHVLGQPGFPVVMTSVNDCTVGAGYTPSGEAQVDTFNVGACAPGQANPGDWQGLRFDEYSYDRNVAVVTEGEGETGGFGDENAEIGIHEDLGELAPNLESGDETVRLGFTVHGTVSSNQDVDLYGFKAKAGTLVWIDIDETSFGLDTIVELIDGDGSVLALSQDSRFENNSGSLEFVSPSLRDGHALPMELDHNAPVNVTGEYRDLFSNNDGDSAMRVVLPGATGSERTYYVRVRSNNPEFAINPTYFLDDSAGINQGLDDLGGTSNGGYQLQIRLQEVDDFAGSVVKYADIRYATIGIDATGQPAHSPLAGEVVHTGGTLDLGTFANTDRGAISAAGDSGSVQTYQFTVGRDSFQAPTDSMLSLSFDVDYADGLTRPDTSLYLYDDEHGLIAIGTNSNITDDRVAPITQGLPTTEGDQSRGSFGARDPFLGPLELDSTNTYDLEVANNSRVARDLNQFFQENPDNPHVRLEPLDSTLRIIDDRFDVGNSPTGTAGEVPVALEVGFNDDGSNVIPFQFGDLSLIVLASTAERNGNNSSQLNIFNPFTGRHDSIIDEDTQAFGAIAQNTKNQRIAIERAANNNGNPAIGDVNQVYLIAEDGSISTPGTTGIQTFEHFVNNQGNNAQRAATANEGARAVEFRSLAYYNDANGGNTFLYGLADRQPFDGSTVFENNGTNTLGAGVNNIDASNLIYLLNPDTGAAISRNQTNLPGGFESANPLSGALQNDNGYDIPLEAAWAGTNVIAQIQVPSTVRGRDFDRIQC